MKNIKNQLRTEQNLFCNFSFFYFAYFAEKNTLGFLQGKKGEKMGKMIMKMDGLFV